MSSSSINQNGVGIARSDGPEGRAQRDRDAGAPVVGAGPAADIRDLLTDEVVDELLQGARTESEIVGPDGLLGQLVKRLVERSAAAELTAHLGYEPHAEPPGGTGNARNGTTPKTLQTTTGPVEVQMPRDRAGRRLSRSS